MKIHFSNVNFSSFTGPNTFAHRLASQLTENGHEIVGSQNEYEIFLAFIEPASQPRPGSKVIQRLDGIWSKPEDFQEKNKLIKLVYENADAVIFQSDFDKKYITTHWGLPKQYATIMNGIEIEKKPTTQLGLQQLRKQYGIIYVCSAQWHPQKRLHDNIKLFKHLQKIYDTPSCLIVLGGGAHQVADPNIFYTGNVPHDICLEIYSMADWMIHLAYADHMPNVCVEALSQDCPIICSNVGGTAELVEKNGIIIKEANPFDFTKPFNYDSPPSIDITQVQELPEISVNKTHIDIKNIAKQYESLFTKLS